MDLITKAILAKEKADTLARAAARAARRAESLAAHLPPPPPKEEAPPLLGEAEILSAKEEATPESPEDEKLEELPPLLEEI